jgi:hypothetical protein
MADLTDLARVLAAPALWLAAFSGVYALQGLGCALDWPDVRLATLSLLRVALLAAWGGAILLHIALLLALRSDRFLPAPPFAHRIGVTLGWVGLGATLWTLQPVALASACN